MCIFCGIASHEIEANIVYETDNIVAFLDSSPINEGHTLIIPKKHFCDADEIPDDLLSEIMCVSKKIVSAMKKSYSPEGYSVMQNGGQFNDIGHYHLHVFPRYKNDGFSWSDLGKKHIPSAEIADKIRKNLH